MLLPLLPREDVSVPERNRPYEHLEGRGRSVTMDQEEENKQQSIMDMLEEVPRLEEEEP